MPPFQLVAIVLLPDGLGPLKVVVHVPLRHAGLLGDFSNGIADLQQELLKKAKANQDYEMLGKEITRLREEKYQLQLEDANREGVRQKVADLETFFGELDGEVTEYDDSLVRRLIERITVYDDHFTVEFKSGIEVDVEL